jgi:hypothetical protein
MMDDKSVRKLEKEFEKSMIDSIMRLGLKHLPLLPSHRTIHLMAKAAVAVYEAAVEAGDSHERS